MNLLEIGQGVFALIHPEPVFGNSNLGLVIDGDGLTIVDCGPTPQAGHVAKKLITGLTAELGLPLKRVIVSSSRAAFSGGSWAFWQSAFYGTPTSSDQLDVPPNLEALSKLMPQNAKHYHDEFETRPVTHEVAEPAWLTPSCLVSPMPGESAENLVVQTPGVQAVFAGALASFGVTPLAYDGDPVAWIQSLDALIALDCTVIPGHGVPGGTQDLQLQRNYLEAVVEADGDPAAIPPGPWDTWADRRFDEVNVERAARMARGDHSIPDSMFRLLGL